MVGQTEMRVARYRRQEAGRWIFLQHRAPDDRAELESMGCALGLAETYEPLVFREDPAGRGRDTAGDTSHQPSRV